MIGKLEIDKLNKDELLELKNQFLAAGAKLADTTPKESKISSLQKENEPDKALLLKKTVEFKGEAKKKVAEDAIKLVVKNEDKITQDNFKLGEIIENKKAEKISEEDFKKFTEKDEVSRELLTSIKEKVKSHADLSPRETAIFNARTTEINNIILKEKKREDLVNEIAELKQERAKNKIQLDKVKEEIDAIRGKSKTEAEKTKAPEKDKDTTKKVALESKKVGDFFAVLSQNIKDWSGRDRVMTKETIMYAFENIVKDWIAENPELAAAYKFNDDDYEGVDIKEGKDKIKIIIYLKEKSSGSSFKLKTEMQNWGEEVNFDNSKIEAGLWGSIKGKKSKMEKIILPKMRDLAAVFKKNFSK